MTVTVEGVQRRFLILQGLRWLPVGFIAPLLVLILTRELSLTQVGTLLAVYSVTTALLELPTGGLADSIGRRPILLVSSATSVGLFALLLAPASVGVLGLAMVIGGISRALDSGPLESWFVDRSRAIDPGVDLRVGLSRAGAVDGSALALGSVVGGLIPELFDGRLLAAVVVGLAFQVVHLVAVFVLMDEVRPPDRSGFRSNLSTVPATVAGAIRLASVHRPVRRLLLGAATIGVGIVSVEHLFQPRFVDLLGRESGGGTGFLGVLLALGFFGAAAGSALAPPLARLIERYTSAPATIAQLVGGVALVLMALTTSTPLAAALFVVFYGLNGLAGPLTDELMHENVPADRRSTIVSVSSLAVHAGALISALTLTALADRQGIPIAWAIGGATLALGSFFYIGVGHRPLSKPGESHLCHEASE